MVTSFEFVRLFHGKDVVAFLDHAQNAVRPRGMRAELAWIDIRKVVAHGASPNGSFDLEDRFGQFGGIGLIHLQYEKCEPMSGLGADAGKLLELFDESVDRLC